MDALERTSSLRCLRALSPSSFLSSTSVAITRAPSAAKICAMARPIPCPAAVMSASLFCKRKAMISISVLWPTNGFHAIWFMRRPPELVVLARAVSSRQSVTIPRHICLRYALIFQGRLEHHAAGELVDYPALYFLPRRLAWRIFVATRLLQLDAALCKFGFRDQHVGSSLIEIDPNTIAGLEQGKSTASRGFGRSVDDRRRGRGTRLTAVPNAGQRRDLAFDQRARRLHVHGLRRPRIPDRPDTADEQHRARIDLQ